MWSFFDVGHAFLRHLEPEIAHNLLITSLRAGIYPCAKGCDPDSLNISLWGMKFSNPISMAAGFDKNAMVPNALLDCGFGFAEVGTLTPQPQQGSARPRVFRLAKDRAVINRIGFCNKGNHSALNRMKKRRQEGIVGVNLGANMDSVDRIADYVAGIRVFAGLASYFTINISSPNTFRLRDLQMRNALDDLLVSVLRGRDEWAMGTPVLLKISPDLSDDALKDIADIAMHRMIDGLIVSNTTVTRPADMQDNLLAKETGGLSGSPLFRLSTRILAHTHRLTGGAIPLIGVGGIENAETAYQKIRAGASLLQLYSAFIYSGYGLLNEIKLGLLARLQRDGFSCLHEAVGSGNRQWCETSLASYCSNEAAQ